jgi:hypothetical protein
VGATNTSGVNSVWARDLVFGAWDFEGFQKAVRFHYICQLLVSISKLDLSDILLYKAHKA